MTNIRALLIQEERGYTASNNLLQCALKRAGFALEQHFGAKPPESMPWGTDLKDTTLFLGSLLLRDGKLSDDEEKRWAEYITSAIHSGAGLVAMLDGSTVGVLTKLINVKLPVAIFDEVKDITFRPILTECGKKHEALQDLTKLALPLPPFGSIVRSYYRTLARKDELTQVLMEVPEYIDQEPTIPAAWAKDYSPNDYILGQAYPFVVVRKPIAVMAADWCNTGGREFVRWQHASIWLASLACAATGLKMKDLNPQLESDEPAHWFLKEDRKHFIPNWGQIEEKLSTPIEEPTSPVTDQVQASAISGQTLELPCSETPAILRDNDEWLEAKLCNGVVVRLNKKAMQVGYRLIRDKANEIALAKDPPDPKSMPCIFAPWPWQQLHYEGHGVVAECLEVTYKLGYDDLNKPSSYFHWTFIPARNKIEGVEWTCVGEQFALRTHESVERFSVPRHYWKLGDEVACHSTRRFACYGVEKRRGFVHIQFDKETPSDPFHWFRGGQPFQMLTYSGNDANRTLWCYTTTAAAIRSDMHRLPNSDYIDIDLQAELGCQTGTIQLPTFWYCFAEEGSSHNLWLSAYDHIRKHFQAEYAIERTYPTPTAVMRYNHSNIYELRNYADIFIPLAKELGFKRIDCGIHCIADLFFQFHGGIDALRYLCDKAHEAGIEVMLYSGTTWMYGEHPSMGFLPDAPAYHGPDWFVWERKENGRLTVKRYAEGGEYQPRDGVKRRVVVLSLRSGWYQYSLAQYAEIKKRTGVDGVWLDSWTWPNQDVNYAEPVPKPAVVEAIQYVADLQKLGYVVLVEGQSPAALESFWYRPEYYAPLRGNEFCLAGMSPLASNGDGLLTLDLFRLLAYGCAMYQDIRILADAYDEVPKEVTKLAKACNKMMNSIHEKLGMPLRVRELSITESNDQSLTAPIHECKEDIENAPIGTFWECEKGIAIFGLRTANQLRIDLPSITSSHVLVEQHDIRSQEDTTNMQIGSEGTQVYLEGPLAAGGVVVVQAALENESTDIYLPLIQA